MKNPVKCIVSLLLAVLAGLTALSGLASPAFAREGRETVAYVLSLNQFVEGYPYSGQTYQYTSPFQMGHRWTDPGTGTLREETVSAGLLQLVNTVKLSEGGKGAYASLPAYPLTPDTGTGDAASYRRINLEDGLSASDGKAARLRAVLLSSFPYVQDLSQLTEAANAWLNANGMAPMEQLQIGEVILATQQAIWQIAGDGGYTVLDPYTGCADYDGIDTVCHINAAETETANTGTNIVSFCRYLLSRKGVGPKKDAASEASFENVAYSAVKADDGTYSVTVEFAVNTALEEGDILTLTAACGGMTQTRSLSSGGIYSVSFRGLSCREEVWLSLDGWQTGKDVYLFEALDDAGQPLIGYDDSRLPVHGAVTASPDRVLNLYKTADTDTGRKPLANIEFELYRVADMEQLEKQEVTLSEIPTQAEIDRYGKPENRVAVLKTDVQGFATYNFTKNRQPDGVYLVVERFSSATAGPIEPFYLIIPGTTGDGTGYAYTVTVNPQNTAEAAPGIRVDVSYPDNQSDSFDVDADHTWLLRCGVPAGLGEGQEYTVTDTLDPRLTYRKGSVVVTLYDREGIGTELAAGIHYLLSEETVEEPTGDGQVRTADRVSVSLTAQGMAFAASCLGSGSAVPELRIGFRAAINPSAAPGEEIPNMAHLDYTNAAGMEYSADSDVSTVCTGGVVLQNTDAEGNPLAGASFRIAREATGEELLDGSIGKETLTVEGNAVQVVYGAFFPSDTLSGEQVREVTTDAAGRAVFSGLACGTWYLVETKAPAGYNLLTAPIRVEVTGSSHLGGKETVGVVSTRFLLPQNGG